MTDQMQLDKDAYYYGLAKAGGCSQQACDLMVKEVIKFTYLPPLGREDELSVRANQFESLTSIKIDGISAGDKMARRFPALSELIFDQIERLCNLPFATDKEELTAQLRESADVASRIAKISGSAH